MTDHDLHLPDDAVDLPAGSRMPLLGFGTWQIRGDDAVRATSAALEAGYRHLDTATVYGNEREVGRALADSGVDRADVFLTTKCPPDRVGQELDDLDLVTQDMFIAETEQLELFHWFIRAHLEDQGGRLATEDASTEKDAARAVEG
jgi:diketogulonate reductase-like aldo/keto reductase